MMPVIIAATLAVIAFTLAGLNVYRALRDRRKRDNGENNT